MKSRLKKIIPYIVPGLLLCNVLFHFYLTEKLHLNPWRGGGFAMFSKINPQHSRTLWVRARDINGNVESIRHRSDPFIYSNAVNLPIKSNFAKIKEEFLRQKNYAPDLIEQVVVELWEFELDAKNFQLNQKLLVKYSFDL